MLHGYLSCKESFLAQINFFSRFMRVVAVDMQGFGKSEEMKTPYSLDDYVLEIERVLNFIGEEKVDILAHSFGARVVIKLANKDKRIDKIVFTGAAGLKPRRGLKYVFRKASFFILKKFIKKEKLQFLYSEDYRNLSPVKKKSFQEIVSEHLDLEVEKLKNDCLLVFGKRDRQTPPYMAEKMAKKLCNSKLVFMKELGHFCFVQNPSKFNREVFKILMGQTYGS
jgi:pimeloyl-ACP methyl ester carboxylesterase